MSAQEPQVDRDEVEAMLTVRQEMGAEMEPALVDSMAARIEEIVAQRMRHEGHLSRSSQATALSANQRLTLAIVSVVMAIPLTAISATMIGLIGVIVVMAGLLGINLALGLGPKAK